jgi:hypothetical protein
LEARHRVGGRVCLSAQFSPPHSVLMSLFYTAVPGRS